MSIKTSEISDLLKARIEKFAAATEERNVGTVVTVTDGIVRVHGLADVKYGEMLEFPGGSFGLALNLEQDSVGAVVLGEYKHIVEGATVKTTGRILEVPVGEGLLGRVVDSLGSPIDGKGPISAVRKSPIERVAPGSSAERAGIRGGSRAVLAGMRRLYIGGDALVAVDGEKIGSDFDLSLIMSRKRPGDTVIATVYRGTKKMDVKVTLSELPAR